MITSALKNQNTISFNANPKSSHELMNDIQTEIEKLKLKPQKEITADEYKKIKLIANEARKTAEKELADRISKNKIETIIDTLLEKTFGKFSQWFSKPNSLKTGNKPIDLTKTIVMSVLIGNLMKDVMIGAMTTTISYTNPDLPKEKRIFVGTYDLLIVLVTLASSAILGPGLINKIMNGYKKILKPIEGLPKQAAIIGGLSTFTSFALQTIIAKRIIAPVIATPLSGKLKNKINKKNKNTSRKD